MNRYDIRIHKAKILSSIKREERKHYGGTRSRHNKWRPRKVRLVPETLHLDHRQVGTLQSTRQ